MSGYLVLVNGSHPFTENCDIISDLTLIGGIPLRTGAAEALSALLRHIGAGEKIALVSGWRSRQEQSEIYENSLKSNGPEFTARYVARPGCSEHQTGLAVDLGLRDGEIDFIRPNFPYWGICQRFREAAPKFGFVERYPAGKEDVTGIAHEPWHFRFVGLPHSVIMSEKGLTLEEYLDGKGKSNE